MAAGGPKLKPDPLCGKCGSAMVVPYGAKSLAYCPECKRKEMAKRIKKSTTTYLRAITYIGV